jgi:thiosulfate/3-mercaptopyruvate sulfurtransferase
MAGTCTILDVRWKLGAPPAIAEYAAGHLPGAAFVDLERVFSGEPGAGGRHPLPTVEGLQEGLRAAGVSAARPVVVYDFGDGLAAARAWWTLRWAGHPAVYVLDGGFPAWDGEVSTEAVTPERGDFTVEPGGMPVLSAQEAARVARAGVLLDARAPERFRGETEPIDAVAGHIPGARNMPYGTMIELPPGVPVGAYCGSGITAAHTVLMLHEAGRDDVALYPGSWSHWITDPDRPIATGAQ